MPATTFIRLIAGKLQEVRGQQTSAGAADGGKLVALADDGTLDPSLLPTGVGADTLTVTTSEALAAGDFVNLWDSTGLKARKADASGGDGKRAWGFVKKAATSGAQALVYFEGTNDAVTGQTVGSRVWLSDSAPGKATATPPLASGAIVQPLGVVLSATSISTEIDEPVTLA